MTRWILDVWTSFRATPLWVQIWMMVILVPINFVSVFFMDWTYGIAVAVLAVAGVLPNLALLIIHRGFSKAMALSHVVFWVPLLGLLLAVMTGVAETEGAPMTYLYALFAINAISLGFDLRESVDWLKGDRRVYGRD